MANYVIRGGEEGKARLRIVSDALWPTTHNLLNSAGIKPGMSCLDVGCGGGNVTLAMARLVGPSGMATGIDMDSAKMQMAQQDAEREKIANASFRVLDAGSPAYGEGYDLVYARLLLTHLSDPLSTLKLMINAARPGGIIVVEDMDHSAIFCYPACPALEKHLSQYDRMVRSNGADPDIGPKLPALFRQAGLADLHFSHVQPAFMAGEAKQIHQITLENVAPAAIAAGLASEAEIDALSSELDGFAQNPETIMSYPRIFQLWAQRN
ncbi:MAG: class I SAM-dependent methyltransferase [Rhodospirillaceae bacterium]|jgi:ubiquinone/menaquinone biosynthesis C-methylase UbiE|nr:class I SAM-dependent methyltransferase [Rhodospirillaceae bacterium]MBT4426419.1 class I SAM-dependent methyltransferase [Rhodospirillaceae bacterium]MBT5778407.1 class I SAM-dependent methyltransferase [Rhodospirillaceae bacterium]MBT6827956.1 class I SAM-dependent methyltransferase [Rhodospirillaceae bacterium]